MTRKRWLTFTLIFLFPLNTYAIKNQTFDYDATINGKHHIISLSVEHNHGEVTATYFNEFGDKEISTYDESSKLLRSVYFNPSNTKFAEADYDYFNNKIIIKSSNSAEYIYKDPTFDNNGTIFYLFSIFQPDQKGKRLNFHLCQTNMSHITDKFQRDIITNLVGPVPMYLKYVKNESLTIDKKVYETKKLEMGISVGTIALFWPNKYYFWYSIDNHYMIKYAGVNDKGSHDTYYLKQVTSHEMPMPELPSL